MIISDFNKGITRELKKSFIIQLLYGWTIAFGVDLKILINGLPNLPRVIYEYYLLKKQKKNFPIRWKIQLSRPCLMDRYEVSGAASGHYFHQDLLIAHRIFERRPNKHVDVGSRIDGFVAHVASFRPIEVMDIRRLTSGIPNVKFIQCDLMVDLNSNMTDYCDSLSCLHALEHFGLGRYGDPINYNGYLLGLENLYKIIEKGGKFYFSVPIGPQRIEFNAHRVFSLEYLLSLIIDKYHIDHFSFVDDKGNLHENVTIDNEKVRENFGCRYGCGIFEMTKI